MINIELMQKYGAVRQKILKGGFLFYEGDKAVYYYQILSGAMKMNNYDESGNETVQGIFKENQSFGEPAILGNFEFPANAEAIENTTVIKLEKNRFFLLLKEHSEISLQLLATLSKRLRFKAILSKEVKSYDAEHRVLTLLHLFKNKNNQTADEYIDLTRQTIANLTGLRVETVIRVIKKLESQQKLKIIKRKIYL
ncbi:MAG: Crp/Fnr family transcriptional regulator [Chitinophagales bacterium]